MCIVPHIMSYLVETVGSELETHFHKKFKRLSDDEEEFIRYEDNFGISASNGCLRRLISTGTDG